MDFKQVVNSLMTMGTTKSSSKSCKTIFSRNGIFQSSSLGLKLIVILQIIFIQINIHSVTAQFCAGGTVTFDKITRVDLRNANPIPLFSSRGNTVTAECNNRCRASADCLGFLVNYDRESCSRLDSNSDESRQDIVSTPNKINYFEKVCLRANLCEKAWIYDRVPGYELVGYDQRVKNNVLTRMECQELCLEDNILPCRSCEYDYTNKTCRLSQETRRTQPSAYRATTADVDYLENQCAENPIGQATCDYQEYENQDIGFPDLQITVANQAECQKRCDETTAFNCRSFTFFPGTNLCRLSGDDNLSSGPTALQTSQGANYYQKAPCVDSLKESSTDNSTDASSNLNRRPKQFDGSGDGNTDLDEPEVIRCHQHPILAQTTRSFATFSIIIGAQFLHNYPLDTFAYFKYKVIISTISDPCISVSLVCGAKSMTVTLTTKEGFEGVLYSYSNVKRCRSRGLQRTETALRFFYEEDEAAVPKNEQCGVVKEEKGIFSATVVIQNHPIIQQKGDRAIKIYCYFETGEKTISNSYNVLADTIPPGPTPPPVDGQTPQPGIPTSIVNGTAPTPSVVLRITDGQGNDIDGTRLGEPLYLRIELDGDSIFDIFARNLVAQSGVDEEEIVLLDDSGCPADPVFPGLTKEPGTGALLGRFEAFKFSETTVVNFEVNVQFCQDQCNPVDCGGGVLSYGRKKRSADGNQLPRQSRQLSPLPDDLADKLTYDPNLHQEVIVYDTPLRKQIFVDPGIKVNRFTDPTGGEVATGRGFTDENGVFVQGDFNNPEDVVCTTWTWVYIGATCMIFLVFSILVVCVLCIYTNRRSSDQGNKSRHYLNSAHHSIVNGVSDRGMSTSTPGVYYETQATYRTPHTPVPPPTPSASGYSRSRTPDHSASTLKSLRTSLRD